MRITLIEATNFKRLKAVRLEPSPTGLTVLNGRNGQGKTSVLDAIAFAFGGKKYCPSNPRRDGAIAETKIHIETDNGLVLERKGKNLDLIVTDSTGKRQGQTLLDAFISEFAINLPKFLNQNDKEKADTLLQILGIGEELDAIDREIKAKYDSRMVVGRQADQKKKAADDMPYHEDVPDEPVSVKELLDRQQEVLGRNGVKQRLAADLESNKRQVASYRAQLQEIEATVKRLEKAIADAERQDLSLEDTSELEKQIADYEETNRLIAENKAKREREDEATDLRDQYDAFTDEIETLRKKKYDILKGAELPFPGLGVNDDGVLTLDGKAWDCFSSSQQLVVGTAIASRLNPECKFVLLDKLEQLDLETLEDFDKWLGEHDLQAIATRVSSDPDASLVIEDGEVKDDGEKPVVKLAKKPTKAAKPAPKPLSDDDWD